MNIERQKRRCLPMGAAAYFGGSSSSASTSKTTTNQIDKRWVVGEGSIAVNAENNSAVSVNVTDAGLVSRALDTVDAIAGEGFQRLLDTGESLIGLTQKHVADAYAQATQETRGTFDQRTIIILAGLAVAGLVLTKGFKGFTR